MEKPKGPKQTKLTKFAAKYKKGDPRWQMRRDYLVRLCAQGMIAYNIVNNIGFKDYSELLDPTFEVPHRTTLANRTKTLYE